MQANTAYEWNEWQTGGGCEAFGMNYPDGSYLILTGCWGGDLPTVGHRAMVWLHSADGDPVGKPRFIRYDGQTTLESLRSQPTA